MFTHLNRAQPYTLALFRFVIGFLFACHGATSLFHAMGGGNIPAGTWPVWYAAMIQLVGGTLVALGLGTRIAALICSGSMAYAYFNVHQPESLYPAQNGGEASALFCWAFLLLVFTGPGAVAVDRLFSSRAATAHEERTAREKAPAVPA
ncbi:MULTISPECIES: DoxX family protein [unclassified Streptomyces]|uniref:DoxX family protein n=1 Tax=Streptomyces TaxID=1883 RepID=UPI0001C19CE7|nr:MULTISPECIES: DoxX family protein [unclassified Streptomyces]HBF79664.1 DoxX family protein [Streptomyces sp.]AEN09743.1 DoxX family protein [Streptomyces sp. SirexAA-E]MYR64704.1 DoxX family membrane protein [Streptomyces sp. SID4939]MYS01464.1 DoxX family membrane protein [Streptomyces sp. SID4940]MYT64399.1 DoxX family membrane protein [Streptomyces sp. SID8357]